MTNLHILGVRKTFEKLEKELKSAFADDKKEECPVCKPVVPDCPPNNCPPLPVCPKPTEMPPIDDSRIPIGGTDPPPPPYDEDDLNAPSKKHITYKRIYEFFTQSKKARLEEDLLLFKIEDSFKKVEAKIYSSD